MICDATQRLTSERRVDPIAERRANQFRCLWWQATRFRIGSANSSACNNYEKTCEFSGCTHVSWFVGVCVCVSGASLALPSPLPMNLNRGWRRVACFAGHKQWANVRVGCCLILSNILENVTESICTRWCGICAGARKLCQPARCRCRYSVDRNDNEQVDEFIWRSMAFDGRCILSEMWWKMNERHVDVERHEGRREWDERH